jgi:hypothetical protein
MVAFMETGMRTIFDPCQPRQDVGKAQMLDEDFAADPCTSVLTDPPLASTRTPQLIKYRGAETYVGAQSAS